MPGLGLEDSWRSLFRFHQWQTREAMLRPTDPPRVVFVVRGFVRFYTPDWESLRHSAVGALVDAVQSRMLEHKARHAQILQNRDTRRRVDALRAWKPDWWVRAPQYHLANYLGVSEVTLEDARRAWEEKFLGYLSYVQAALTSWSPTGSLTRNARFAVIASTLPVGRMGTPADIAQAIVFLIQNSFVTGAVLDVDGGIRLK